MFKQSKKDCVYYFYALFSEVNPEEIRYVDVTTRNIKDRFYEHMACAKSKNKAHPVHKWIYHNLIRNIQTLYVEIDYCSYIEWRTREIYWINYYKSNNHRLLNIQKGGQGVVTKEMRNQDGYIRSGLAKRKVVEAYNLDGTFFKRFSSMQEAAKYFNCKSKSTITWRLKEGRTACGYNWKVVENTSFIPPKITNPDYNKPIKVN